MCLNLVEEHEANLETSTCAWMWQWKSLYETFGLSRINHNKKKHVVFSAYRKMCMCVVFGSILEEWSNRKMKVSKLWKSTYDQRKV